MLIAWHFFVELGCLLAAILVGLWSWSRQPTSARLLVAQLITWLGFYLLANAVTRYQKMNEIPRNNHWVFNLYIVIEGVLLLLAAHCYLRSQRQRRFVYVLVCAFLASYAYLMIDSGIGYFNKFAFLTESLSVTIVWLAVAYYSFQEESVRALNAVRCFAVGLLIYFGCNVPYFAFFDYLNIHHSEISEKTFYLLTDVLANLRYILMGTGFWIIATTQDRIAQART